MLIAVNLRPALTSVPPLVSSLRTDLHLSSGALAAVTALPLLVFGLLSMAVPAIGRAWRPERAMAGALGLLVVALVVRTASGPVTLLVGTGVAAAAIAMLNVLIPGVVRRDFHDRTGLATGLYAMALGVGATAGAATAVPLHDLAGGRWQPALAAWTVPAALALAAWLVVGGMRRGPSRVLVDGGVPTRMFRQPLAWSVLAFLGLQSLVFFTLIAWLPALLQDGGQSPTRAGAMLAVAQFAGIPGSLIVPQLAMRGRNQVVPVVATVALTAIGLAGLAFAPAAAPWVWSVCVGVGSTAFPLGLTLIVLRARSASATDSLSGFAQSGAYLMAAVGPLLAGSLRQTTNDWQVPMLALLALTVPQLIAGMYAGRDRLIP